MNAGFPEPSQEQIQAAWDRIKAADLNHSPTVATADAVTMLDAYLHTALKLKALEENT